MSYRDEIAGDHPGVEYAPAFLALLDRMDEMTQQIGHLAYGIFSDARLKPKPRSKPYAKKKAVP